MTVLAQENSERRHLLQEAARNCAACVKAVGVLDAAVADRLALNLTDRRVYDLLSREGPLRPSELGKHTGLTSSSISLLLDRLERRGFVERIPDPADQRKLFVRALARNLQVASDLTNGFSEKLYTIHEKYDNEHLQLFAAYLAEICAAAGAVVPATPPRR